MIDEDFVLIKEIFSIIDAAVVDGYDSFCFEVEVEDGFMETELVVERNGVELSNARANINDAILYGLVKRLRESAERRGEYWISFVMAYRCGGQVKTSFKYEKDSA